MAVTADRPSVTTSATVLTAGAEADFVAGRSVLVTNPGPTEVCLGGADVTTADGYPLASGLSASLELNKGEALYGIVATGTQTVHVLQAGV